MSIAHKTYFQKIADPGDIAPTSGVTFSINHLAAVFLPIPLGIVWDIGSSAGAEHPRAVQLGTLLVRFHRGLLRSTCIKKLLVRELLVIIPGRDFNSV
jgi:hypothetical protein